MLARINAPSAEEAEKIADTLVKEKLVAGASISKSRCRYLWDGNIHTGDVWYIHAHSLTSKKEEIISVVRENHSDECPIVEFSSIEGNSDFLKWIEDSVA